MTNDRIKYNFETVFADNLWVEGLIKIISCNYFFIYCCIVKCEMKVFYNIIKVTTAKLLKVYLMIETIK